MSEIWESPFYSAEENLEMCAGAYQWMKEVADNQRKQKELAQRKWDDAKEIIEQRNVMLSAAWAEKQELLQALRDSIKIVRNLTTHTQRGFYNIGLEKAEELLEKHRD